MTKNGPGYTLIEVLVAVVILSLVLPGLTYMVVGSRKAQISSYRMEQGAAYGQLVIDSLSILPPGARSATNRTSSATIGGVTYTSSWTFTAQGAASLVTDTVKFTRGGKTEYVIIRGVVR
ncbi:MAG: prepilin-type N-terminal cleavage/methylation domain-containing protein [Fibrobacterota bacterium]|nr:prepilin-type N-terminal cleavage/methylation domain-containing protein [Fibrobacterota bacterium]QQS05426.1 MAG: prepilin-type N-terminal cleavage/methylation domain-containing protein [Fibrobacterota bacterium]